MPDSDSSARAFTPFTDTIYHPDSDPDADTGVLPDEPPAAGFREGLPAGNRMRHDAHYVDELHSTRPVPDRSVAVPRDVVRELLDSVGTLASCLNLIPSRNQPLAGRVALDLMHSELTRAAWLLAAVQALGDEPMLQGQAVDIRAIAEQVIRDASPETTLRGRTIAFDADGREVWSKGDPALLRVAIAGALHGMQALGTTIGSTVRLRVRAARATMSSIEIDYVDVRLPSGQLDRLFDVAWTDRPGGATAAVGFAVARRLARLHGGSADARSLDGGGCRLIISLPAA